MTAAPAAVLLVELTRRGIELDAEGRRLRYRPKSVLTPGLAQRMMRHKAELLQILHEASRNQSLPHCTDAIRAELDAYPRGIRSTINRISNTFRHDARTEVVEVTTIWARRFSTTLATVEDVRLRTLFRDLFEERAAQGQYVWGLALVEAERTAYEEVRAMIESTRP